MAKNYSFSKTKAKQLIVEAFGDDLNKTVKLADVVKLFEPQRNGNGRVSMKNVVDANGNIIARHCSVLNAYLPISEFGTMGKAGYASASKVGLKLKREREAQIKQLEEAILNETDFNKIKELQRKIKELREAPYTCPKEIKCAKTPEEALKLFGQTK